MAILRVMHDIADGQLVTSDGRRVGRVADIGCRRTAEGELEAVALVLGPEAGLRRLASRLSAPAHRLFGGRHERWVDIDELAEFGPTLRLRAASAHYDLHDGEEWAARILRLIPGSAYTERPKVGRRSRRSASLRPDAWVSDLVGTPVEEADGRRVGRVAELHIGPRHHRVTEVVVGSAGWLERLGIRRIVERSGSSQPSRVDWQRVESVDRDRIRLRAGRPSRPRR